MATIQPIKPISVTQGQMSADGKGINNFNPLTGQPLTKGQTVNVPPVNATVSSDVMNTNPVTVRPNVPSTTAIGLEQGIMSEQETLRKQKEDAVIAEAEKTQATQKSGIADIFAQQAGLGAQQEQLYKELGADEAQKQADEYTSQIEAESLATRRRIESLQKNNPQGLFGGAMQQEVNRIQNESTMKQADLAILQNAALRKFDTATSIADRKIKLATEALSTRLEGLKFFYEDNKETLTKAQDRQYQEAINKQERALDKAEKEATTITNLGLQVATNQAPAAIASKALAAKSIKELMAIPGIGKYLLSPGDRLDISIKQQTLSDKRDAAKAASEAKSKGLLTEDQYKTATDLRKEYNGLTEVKNAKDSETTTTALVSSLAAKNPTSDIAAINSFQRLAVDPGVSVREGDVALLQSANSFGDKAWLRTNGYMKGDKLTDNARADMQALALKIHDARIGYATEQTAPIRTTAKGYGIDFDTYVGAPFVGSQAITQKVSDTQQAPAQQSASYLDKALKPLELNADPAAKFQGTPFQPIFN